MTPEEALMVEAARRGLLPPAQAIPTAAEKSPSVRQFMDRATDAAVQGVSLGFGDEIGAAGAATGAALRNAARSVGNLEMPSLSGMGQAASDRYDQRLSELRGGLKEFRQTNPVAATGAELLGGLATGGAAGSLGMTGPATLPSMAARGAASGAAFGGAYGLGTGEGAEQRLREGVKGAATGAAIGGVLGGVGGALAQRSARKAIPSLDDLDAQAGDLYAAARQAGLVVKDTSFSQFADDLAAAAKQAGIDKDIHPKASAAVRRFVDAKGSQPTLDELDLLRRVAGSAAKSNEPDERRIASIIIGKVDDYLGGLSPADLAAGDAKVASDAITQARGLWSRMRRGEAIQELIDRANISAANFSGSGKENALRSEFRAFAKNPKKMRGFSQEEQDAIRRVAMGGPVENFLRMVGKFAPTGVVSSALSGGVGYGVGGPVGAVALPAAGYAARAGATALTGRNAQMAAELARAGGAIQAQPMSPEAQALIRALSVTGIQQAGNENSILRQQLARALSTQ